MVRRFLIISTCVTVFAAPAFAEQSTLRALGNEPFWRADVAAATLTVTRPDFDPLTLPVTQHAEMEGFALVTAEDDGRAARAILLLAPEICRDTMSGQPHPQRAQLALGDMTYHGCAGDPRTLLTGAEWQMIEIAGQAVQAGTGVSLRFDTEGRIAGSDGCNRIMAGYAMTGEGLSIGPEIASTMMACPDPIMAQARVFTSALVQIDRFDFDDQGRLLLVLQDGTVMLADRRAE